MLVVMVRVEFRNNQPSELGAGEKDAEGDKGIRKRHSLLRLQDIGDREISIVNNIDIEMDKKPFGYALQMGSSFHSRLRRAFANDGNRIPADIMARQEILF